MHVRLLASLSLIVALPAVAAAQDTGLAGMHDQRREGGRICMTEHFHTGNGTGSTKEAARKAAIASWTGYTSFEYGNRWANFANSASKGIKYDKTASGWNAYVESRPCRR